MATNLWTREELILALNLYLKLPFGKLHSRTPEIIHLAKIMGRTPGSISMRLNNFASIDPYHQQRGIVGLSGGKKQVEPVWNEFINNKEDLIFESERILAKKENITLENKFSKILSGTEDLKGETKIREVKTRVNQDVFRQIVLSNYSSKCAITGIDIPELLIASHIIPWSDDEKNRMNPANGLCLNALHDKAFDKGLITITPDFIVRISNRFLQNLKKSNLEIFFLPYIDKKITLPYKFLPVREFLEYHNSIIFKNNN